MTKPLSVKCQLVRETASGPESTRLLADGDSAFLLIALGPIPESFRNSILWVELVRGDAVRDVIRQPLADASGSGAELVYRLDWSFDPKRSRRLSVRVRLDETLIEHFDLLLNRPYIDGQGRFLDEETMSGMSATLLAFVSRLECELRRGEKERRCPEKI